MKSFPTLIALTAAATLICAPAIAQTAQGTPPGQGMPGQQGAPASQPDQPAQDFSSDDLERFNEARLAVEEVRNEYAGKLQGVQDAGEARELQTEASEKMTEQVEDAGLEVETYNAIAMAARTDPDLRRKLMDLGS